MTSKTRKARRLTLREQVSQLQEALGRTEETIERAQETIHEQGKQIQHLEHELVTATQLRVDAQAGLVRYLMEAQLGHVIGYNPYLAGDVIAQIGEGLLRERSPDQLDELITTAKNALAGAKGKLPTLPLPPEAWQALG